MFTKMVKSNRDQKISTFFFLDIFLPIALEFLFLFYFMAAPWNRARDTNWIEWKRVAVLEKKKGK